MAALLAGGLVSQRDWIGNPTILSGEIGDVSSVFDNSYAVVEAGYGSEIDGLIIEEDMVIRSDDANTRNGGGLQLLGNHPMTIRNVVFRELCLLWRSVLNILGKRF